MLYSFLFLINKYIGFNIFERLLSLYEEKYIKKYISKKEVRAQEIPTINATELTEEIFEQLSDNYRKPVLIKGYLKDTNAVKSWTENYLKEIIDDDFNIKTFVLNDGKLDVEHNRFTDIIDNMKTDNIYINNESSIISTYPQLLNDIKDKFISFIETLKNSGLRNIHHTHLFIGYNTVSKISGTNMHCAGTGNFFCMIKGCKKWTLIDPKYSIFLKGRVSQSGIHAQTLIDMPDTDISVEPDILHHLPRYEIVLEPGDILWNAPWWWHRIKNINEKDEYNIGMAIRHSKVSTINLKNNLLYTISGSIYLVYNSFFLSLYERLFMKKYEITKLDDNKMILLKEIDELTKKYPKTYELTLTKDKDQ